MANEWYPESWARRRPLVGRLNSELNVSIRYKSRLCQHVLRSHFLGSQRLDMDANGES